MSEERSNKRGIVACIGELFVDALIELFAAHQRTSRKGGTLGVAQDRLIGVEIRRVVRQGCRVSLPCVPVT
ncbi:hypothetical protein OKW43_006351 [Paraburkholderia sp. WC7.3g]